MAIPFLAHLHGQIGLHVERPSGPVCMQEWHRGESCCTALLQCRRINEKLIVCRFWANMYLAQFYDDAVSASRHPSIVIDQGFMAVNQGAFNYEPVGDTGKAFLCAARHNGC